MDYLLDLTVHVPPGRGCIKPTEGSVQTRENLVHFLGFHQLKWIRDATLLMGPSETITVVNDIIPGSESL